MPNDTRAKKIIQTVRQSEIDGMRRGFAETWDAYQLRTEQRQIALIAAVSAELEAAIADRDMEWWRELALNDAVAPNPEEVKKWVIMERDLAVVEERQQIADMVTNGDYCRMVDHMQGFCECEEMRADILRGPALIPLDDPEGENFEQIACEREKSLG